MFPPVGEVVSTTSPRVKAIDFHPTEPVLAAALFNGTVVLFNTNDMSVIRTIRTDTEKPIRCVQWLPSMNCVIAGGDDLTISCFDSNTGSLIASKAEAHQDFIRQIAVHPTQAHFLSCSDDQTLRLFSFGKNGLTVVRTYGGHTHFVMAVKFNPTDGGATFASGSLDSTIKFWDMSSETAKFTLNGHEAGVNCIEFFRGDQPYLASGSDDFAIKIWDYQTKSCVVTLSGHSANVTGLKVHPVYPLLLSTGEDEMLCAWNTRTFQQETALNYQQKRGWCVDANLNLVAVGYDDGLVLVRVERPLA
jgi:coatomer subunit beta'